MIKCTCKSELSFPGKGDTSRDTSHGAILTSPFVDELPTWYGSGVGITWEKLARVFPTMVATEYIGLISLFTFDIILVSTLQSSLRRHNTINLVYQTQSVLQHNLNKNTIKTIRYTMSLPSKQPDQLNWIKHKPQTNHYN